MSEYRDAETIRKAEWSNIYEAARQMVEALGIDPTDETYQKHAEVLCLALQMYHDRNREVPDAWKRVGWAGNLLTLYGKVIRMMSALWWKPEGSGRHMEGPIDNAVDAINYAIFFIRCVDDNNERGER